jgi:hypothetical protein
MSDARIGAVTKHKPFSNGTEGDAWMAKWCAYCVRDHGLHPRQPQAGEPMCAVIGDAMCTPSEQWRWPECWMPEPDDGEFFLPSRMTCALFEPCTEDDCTGDPAPDARAERVAEVAVYWRAGDGNG